MGHGRTGRIRSSSTSELPGKRRHLDRLQRGLPNQPDERHRQGPPLRRSILFVIWILTEVRDLLVVPGSLPFLPYNTFNPRWYQDGFAAR